MSNTTTHTHIIHIPANEVVAGDLAPTWNGGGWDYAPYTTVEFGVRYAVLHIQGDRGVCHPVASWRPAAAEPAPLVPVAQWGNP